MQIVPYLERASVLFPLYKTAKVVYDESGTGPADGEGMYDINNAICHFTIRQDYPPAILKVDHPDLWQEWLDDICGHELGHPFEFLVIIYHMKKNKWSYDQASVYVHKLYWDFRGFDSTWEATNLLYRDQGQVGWQFLPGESWAEAFKAALNGRWPITPGHLTGPGQEKTYNAGKTKTAAECRAFFQSLVQEVIVIPFEDLTVANNNFYASRDGRVIDTYVLHTMVGTWQSANARFNNPTAQVSAHKGITFGGLQYRWVEDQFTAYHAGDWEINLRSMGVEHEDMSDYNGIRPDVLYSMAGAVLAENSQKHPAIKLDKYHVVPGCVGHRDVHATACPDALDTDRIIWVARRIVGGTPVAAPFDPRVNPDDLKFLQDKFADKAGTTNDLNIIKNAYNPVLGWWLKHGFGTAAMKMPEATVDTSEPREPATNMKGAPPAGHPAHTTKAGLHKPGEEV